VASYAQLGDVHTNYEDAGRGEPLVLPAPRRRRLPGVRIEPPRLDRRARRRARGAAPAPDPDVACQRKVVDAFVAAARGRDFDAHASARRLTELLVPFFTGQQGASGGH
jgi:hypothetical protein